MQLKKENYKGDKNMEKCKFMDLKECEKYTPDPRYRVVGVCLFSSLKFHVCRYKEIIQIFDALKRVEDDSQESYHDVMCRGLDYKEGELL